MIEAHSRLKGVQQVHGGLLALLLREFELLWGLWGLRCLLISLVLVQFFICIFVKLKGFRVKSDALLSDFFHRHERSEDVFILVEKGVLNDIVVKYPQTLRACLVLELLRFFGLTVFVLFLSYKFAVPICN